jgi:glycosyltransferase involved in cell wall biosynthesis
MNENNPQVSGGRRTRNEYPDATQSNPRVSIITVVYNGVAHLEKTIQSVLSQTYPHIEYIIIDGGSTDGTLDIIRQYDDKLDYWISEPDNGIYDAMNKGIRLATGEVIGLLNAGDYYLEGAIDGMIKIYFTNRATTSNMLISGAIKLLLRHRQILMLPSLVSIEKKMPLPHPALFVTRNVYDQVGLFDPSLKISADYDFVWRAFKNSIPIYKTFQVFTEISQPGASGNYFLRNIEDHTVRVRQGVSRFRSFTRLLCAMSQDIAYDVLTNLRRTIRGY